MRSLKVAACLMVFALGVDAGTVTSISPSSLVRGSGEYFMTVAGSGFDGNDSFIFDGPAGHFEVDVNAITLSGDIIGWLPVPIVNNSGTYTLVVRSRSGDSAPVSFTVTKSVRDSLFLQLPDIIVASALSRLGAPIRYEITTVGGDPSTVSIKCDPESGSTFPFGNSFVYCVATDLSGGRDEAKIAVSVTDTDVPKLSVPKDFEVPADSVEGAYVKYDVEAWDDIDGALRPTCAPESGAFFPPGRTSVRCEAADLSLNPAYGSFDVLVRPKDIGTLSLRVPDGLKVAAEDKSGAHVEYEAIAYGSADPDPVVQCEPESGTWFPMGSTKVYCAAYDDFDQRAEAGFVVDVVEGFALKLPDLTEEARTPSGTEVTWEPKAEGWTAEIQCTPSSGSLFALGETTVECQSTDERGRKAAGTFVVNVADTIAPHIESVRADAGALDAARGVLPVDVIVDATDAADAMPRCSVAALSPESDDGAFDWRVESDLRVEVGSAAAQRPFRIQVGCVDASGNRSTASIRVAVPGVAKRRPAH